MRRMIVVAEQQLQRVPALGQRHHHFGLPVAEMDVVVVGRDRLVRRAGIGIDQQMMMPGSGVIDACRRDAHAAQADPHGEALGNAQAIDRIVEIDLRARRSRLARGGLRRDF